MTIIVQFTGVIIRSLVYVQQANRAMFEKSMSQAQFIAENGLFDFRYIGQSLWIIGPIVICATVLIGYVFLIWYRDWFAKNTFIYRLLMLPTARLNIYFAKATAILLFVLGLVGLEMIILSLGMTLSEKIVPAAFRTGRQPLEMIGSIVELNAIIPRTFIQFVLYYAMGFMAVLIVFTGILFERSFGWRGILAGLFYAVASVLLFLAPVIYIIISESKMVLYPEEFLAMEIGLGIIVTAAAIFVSRFLLEKKITV
jgi:hypothetical protein